MSQIDHAGLVHILRCFVQFGIGNKGVGGHVIQGILRPVFLFFHNNHQPGIIGATESDLLRERGKGCQLIGIFALTLNCQATATTGSCQQEDRRQNRCSQKGPQFLHTFSPFLPYECFSMSKNIHSFHCSIRCFICQGYGPTDTRPCVVLQ